MIIKKIDSLPGIIHFLQPAETYLKVPMKPDKS